MCNSIRAPHRGKWGLAPFFYLITGTFKLQNHVPIQTTCHDMPNIWFRYFLSIDQAKTHCIIFPTVGTNRETFLFHTFRAFCPTPGIIQLEPGMDSLFWRWLLIGIGKHIATTREWKSASMHPDMIGGSRLVHPTDYLGSTLHSLCTNRFSLHTCLSSSDSSYQL